MNTPTRPRRLVRPYSEPEMAPAVPREWAVRRRAFNNWLVDVQAGTMAWQDRFWAEGDLAFDAAIEADVRPRQRASQQAVEPLAMLRAGRPKRLPGEAA